MKTALPSEILVSPTRQRREFPEGALQELVDSIRDHGLFHPLVCRVEYDLADRGRTLLHLVAGERRLRAIQDIFALGGGFIHDGELFGSEVPYILLGELDELDREEAELDENIRRQDLTWDERASATHRLGLLRERQAARDGIPAPTTADLALEVRGTSAGVHHDITRQERIVARHLDDPEVKAAGSLKEAFKVLKRKESAKRNIELAESVGRSFTADSHRAFNRDAVEWLTECEDSLYDVILTDPPYGMGADEFGDSGGMNMAAHGYADDEDTFMRCLGALLEHGFRVAKPQAHLYMFCDIDRFHYARASFLDLGWEVHRTPLIWHKPNGSRAPWPDYGPQRKWEMILYAVKGKRPTTALRSDVLTYSNEAGQTHGAQKPVALFMDLLVRSARPGDAVLDPFAGTGPLVEAAHELKCSATVVERDPVHYGTILRRLEKIKTQQELGL